ncbi:MAG: phage tail protein [Gemmatimonadales bacterium]
MTKPQPLTPERLGPLTTDIVAVVRRYEPGWTGSGAEDPGLTLLAVMEWLGEGLSAFQAHPTRSDPYNNFKFRVKWDGAYVPGISRVSGLGRIIQAVEYREGAEPNVVHRALAW